MPRPRPPFLHRETTRHGQVVWFVRREHGARIRIRAEYDSKDFWEQYRAALSGSAPISKTRSPKAHTLAWAVERYRFSSAWAEFAPATRKQREAVLRIVVASAGDELLSDINQDVIRDGRERRAATPHSANNFLKAMRGLFAWAVEFKHVEVDPTKGVPLLKGRNDEDGFHTWTEEEVARFEARWPLGTRERLAFDVLLYTGLRRGDAVRLGRQHVRDGVLMLRTEKTGEDVVLPILPPLARSIEATRTGDLAFIVTGRGTPFVKESFGTWFREVCNAAGVKGSAHGLRKAGATRAAENGATDRQLMALFGWKDAKMAGHYTRKADKRRLAADAAKLLTSEQPENEKRPHLGSGTGAGPKNSTKTGA